jgi:transcriptional regulator of aromatic amino acid metabolism
MYNCEFSRLMARLQSIADIYQQKASILSSQGCNTDLLQERLDGVKDAVLSADIIYKISQDLENANPAECPVF